MYNSRHDNYCKDHCDILHSIAPWLPHSIPKEAKPKPWVVTSPIYKISPSVVQECFFKCYNKSKKGINQHRRKWSCACQPEGSNDWVEKNCECCSCDVDEEVITQKIDFESSEELNMKDSLEVVSSCESSSSFDLSDEISSCNTNSIKSQEPLRSIFHEKSGKEEASELNQGISNNGLLDTELDTTSMATEESPAVIRSILPEQSLKLDPSEFNTIGMHESIGNLKLSKTSSKELDELYIMPESVEGNEKLAEKPRRNAITILETQKHPTIRDKTSFGGIKRQKFMSLDEKFPNLDLRYSKIGKPGWHP